MNKNILKLYYHLLILCLFHSWPHLSIRLFLSWYSHPLLSKSLLNWPPRICLLLHNQLFDWWLTEYWLLFFMSFVLKFIRTSFHILKMFVVTIRTKNQISLLKLKNVKAQVINWIWHSSIRYLISILWNIKCLIAFWTKNFLWFWND